MAPPDQLGDPSDGTWDRPEANNSMLFERDGLSQFHAHVVPRRPSDGSCLVFTHPTEVVAAMNSTNEITAAKRKRLLKTYGPCPAGYTHEDIERFLHLLYRLFSHRYTETELRQVILSDPFDDSEPPRQITLVDLATWLEAIVA
jgi:hypothetical protein